MRLDHVFSSTRFRQRGLHHRRQLRQHRDPARSFQHGLAEPARAGIQLAGNARFFADLREHRPLRILSRGIFLHRRTHSRTPRPLANGRSRFLAGAPCRSGGRRRQPGFQSASAVGIGGKQQRQQSAHGSKSVHVHRSSARAHRGGTNSRGCLVPAFPVQRRDRAQPIRPVDLHWPAGLHSDGTASFLYDPTPTPMSWRSSVSAPSTWRMHSRCSKLTFRLWVSATNSPPDGMKRTAGRELHVRQRRCAVRNADGKSVPTGRRELRS